MRTLSIRTKLVLLITVVAAVILAGISLAISRSLQREVEREVVADLDKMQHIFRSLAALVYDRLVESSLLIGQNAAFKANVALGDPATVQQAVEEFAQFTKTDLLVVTDRRGQVLAWLGRPGAVGRDLTDQPGMAEALEGREPALEPESAILWEVDSQLYQVVAVPVFAGAAQLGAIAMGTLFTDVEAELLKGESGIEITLFLDDRPVGSSLAAEPDERAARLQEFRRDYRAEIDRSLDEPGGGRVFDARFNDRNVFAFVSPLGVGVRGYYLALVDRRREMALLSTLSRQILLIGLGGFLLAALLAVVLGNRFSRPVLALVRAMDEVRGGRFDLVLPVGSRDEFGRLTAAFNSMIRGLRERLQLMKYVGGHTLNMIRSQEAAWLPSRGDRLDVAVLFTDIRGFTAYTEVVEPEQVIEMLNRWLGFQAELVREHDGFVDKYAGDEMFALFTGEGALERAYRCAQAIQAGATPLARRHGEPISIGIGVHYGPAVMGNIGAESRLDYTVIGASVNLGARLCGAARGGEILLTAEMAERLGVDVSRYAQEEMAFKGMAQAVRVVRVEFEKSEI